MSDADPDAAAVDSTASGDARRTPATSGRSTDGNRELGPVAGWLLVEGNRLVVAGVATAAVLLSFLAVVGAYGPAALRPNSPMSFLFSALVTGDLTLITVVLSINQVVLSRELGDPGTFRRRVGETVDFRREVESTAGTGVSPNAPAEFLRFLHEALGDEASTIASAAESVDDEPCRRRLRSLVESIDRDVRRVDEALERSGDHVFTVVSATIATNHADQFQDITALRRRHADVLAAETEESLSTTEDLLLEIDVARQYFKTVFVQKELAYLSRVLLYVGLPAVVGCGLVLVLYNAASGVPVGAVVLGVSVTVAFVAGFAPLAVLFAFILRLAWVAQQSSTGAPFGAASTYRP